jgi:sulfite dehydrogenase (cytochrome) subunit B
MAQSPDPPRRTQRVVIPLTVLVAVIATAVAYLGTREDPQARPAPLPAPAEASLPVQTIVLPHVEPDLPPGPHRETFIRYCTLCHSTRLVLTQPPFPKAKWEEVVQKMMNPKVYGAPIPAEEKPRIVEYLVAIRGK